MTDLEKHVNQPGRAKLVKKVREKINELGITYIYYQFISVTGRVVGKGIPADMRARAGSDCRTVITTSARTVRAKYCNSSTATTSPMFRRS